MSDCTEYVWKEYHDKLHGFIVSRVNDASAADDILQEVFMRILSRIDTLKDCDKLQSWIYQITRNAIIDHYRGQKKTSELPATLTTAEDGISDGVGKDINNCLIPMIESLPEPYRDAVKLSEIEGKTQKEVAEKEGISLSGAKSRVQRGRAMIKEMMFGCCSFEFDNRGNVIDYERKAGSDCDCECE
ncbi:MAG: RNA polymerase sigma factor SigZ [Planctomycetes bacterium]|nr:RNA polymerase sigma factor SigZ [Planctomycetota bacterium]